MTTLEDIEAELNPDAQLGFMARRAAMVKRDLLGNMIRNLKNQEELLNTEQEGLGTKAIKSLILGQRILDAAETEAAGKKFGSKGIMAIEAMEHMTIPQKQYIFKQMGWDIGEVK